jgi:FdhD protein
MREAGPSSLGCHQFSGGGWVPCEARVPEEMSLTIYVNEEELVTVQCTPTKLNCLVLGFLFSEGVITDLKDVLSMRICEEESIADVRLSKKLLRHEKRILTSGCGGGVSFKDVAERLESSFFVEPQQVMSLLKKFFESMELYRVTGGLHASALADTEDLIVVAEDIGRHNTIDKIQGECLLRGIETRDRMLMTTGRISQEMLLKAARMKVPVVVSRRSPTSLALSVANELGVTVVGHARVGQLRVYTYPERLGYG